MPVTVGTDSLVVQSPQLEGLEDEAIMYSSKLLCVLCEKVCDGSTYYCRHTPKILG